MNFIDLLSFLNRLHADSNMVQMTWNGNRKSTWPWHSSMNTLWRFCMAGSRPSFVQRQVTGARECTASHMWCSCEDLSTFFWCKVYWKRLKYEEQWIYIYIWIQYNTMEYIYENNENHIFFSKNKLWWHPQQQLVMPRLTTWAPFFLLSGFAHVDNVITKRCSKQSHGCLCQAGKATSHTVMFGFFLRNLPLELTPAHTGTLQNLLRTFRTLLTFRNLPPEPTPAHAGTCRKCPEPEPTPAHAGALQNLLHEHAPEPSGTTHTIPRQHTQFRNLTGTYTSTPDLSRTCLHQHELELPGTRRNLNLYQHTHRNSPEPSGPCLPEPTPAHTGTLRNLREPPSGTCSCDPHRHTPELIWAEDPISLCCWKNMYCSWNYNWMRMKLTYIYISIYIYRIVANNFTV